MTSTFVYTTATCSRPQVLESRCRSRFAQRRHLSPGGGPPRLRPPSAIPTVRRKRQDARSNRRAQPSAADAKTYALLWFPQAPRVPPSTGRPSPCAPNINVRVPIGARRGLSHRAFLAGKDHAQADVDRDRCSAGPRQRRSPLSVSQTVTGPAKVSFHADRRSSIRFELTASYAR
jgi:hypothetical protein